jgi:ketosteroid isomerase-like protein
MGQTKDVVDRVWDATEAHDLDTVAALMDSQIDFRMGPERVSGPAEFVPFLEGYLAAFSDFRHEVLDFVESGDTVALELVVRGTHTGPLRMPQGELPATGREVVWESTDYVKVRDGRIASWHAYTDGVAFLSQLGLMPGPGVGG